MRRFGDRRALDPTQHVGDTVGAEIHRGRGRLVGERICGVVRPSAVCAWRSAIQQRQRVGRRRDGRPQLRRIEQSVALAVKAGHGGLGQLGPRVCTWLYTIARYVECRRRRRLVERRVPRERGGRSRGDNSGERQGGRASHGRHALAKRERHGTALVLILQRAELRARICGRRREMGRRENGEILRRQRVSMGGGVANTECDGGRIDGELLLDVGHFRGVEGEIVDRSLVLVALLLAQEELLRVRLHLGRGAGLDLERDLLPGAAPVDAQPVQEAVVLLLGPAVLVLHLLGGRGGRGVVVVEAGGGIGDGGALGVDVAVAHVVGGDGAGVVVERAAPDAMAGAIVLVEDAAYRVALAVVDLSLEDGAARCVQLGYVVDRDRHVGARGAERGQRGVVASRRRVQGELGGDIARIHAEVVAAASPDGCGAGGGARGCMARAKRCAGRDASCWCRVQRVHSARHWRSRVVSGVRAPWKVRAHSYARPPPK